MKIFLKKICDIICSYLGKIFQRIKDLFPRKLLNKEALLKFLLPFVIILFGYLSCTHSQQVINKNIQSIFTISDAIRTYYADKPDFWQLNTDYALKQGIIPKDFIKNGNIILNDNIKILVGSGVNADTVMPLTQSFDIVMPNLNKAQCISYAESELSEAQRIEIISISIINTQGIYVFEWGGKNSLPITKYATKKLCLDKNNTLIWSLK